MIKKQSTLFPEKELKIFAELSLDDAQKLASQIKAFVKMQCDRIEIAGSIRRQKPVVHDLDFVAVPKSDRDWLKINEILKRLKAKPILHGKPTHKSLCALSERTVPGGLLPGQTSNIWNSSLDSNGLG